MKKKHSFQVRRRALVIWQKLGYLPWRKSRKKEGRKKSGDFYKGAFNSIPFLNEDAKRTFAHLLLRPGYMIRDYIKGQHEKYLAPLTSLIVFYAFFALVSAVLQPVQNRVPSRPFLVSRNMTETILNTNGDSLVVNSPHNVKVFKLLYGTLNLADKGWVYLHLDQFPEEVNTQHESSLAALEGTLRSQGIPLFLSQFFFLWLAMAIALRRYKAGMSAYAAASAYILCQFSFFMLFAVLGSLGKDTSISVPLMLVLLIWDYCQWLGASPRKSFRLAVSTGIHYCLLMGAAILLVSGMVFLITYLKI